MSDRDKILADLSAYLDGELLPAAAQRVEQALACDPGVAGELAALRRTRDLVRGLPRVKPSADFVAGVLAQAERFRLVKPEDQEQPRELPIFRWVAAAAVLLVAVGVGITVGVMFLSTTPVDPVKVAVNSPKPSPTEAAKSAVRGTPSGSRAAANVDESAGLAGNNVIYAPGAKFDEAVKEVAAALEASDIKSARSALQDNGGDKTMTILVYADAEQAQRLGEALSDVRRRCQAEDEQRKAERIRGAVESRNTAAGAAGNSTMKSGLADPDVAQPILITVRSGAAAGDLAALSQIPASGVTRTGLTSASRPSTASAPASAPALKDANVR